MKDPSCLHTAVISLKSVCTHRGSMEDRIFINLSLFMWVKDACSVVEMFVAAGLPGFRVEGPNLRRPGLHCSGSLGHEPKLVDGL